VTQANNSRNVILVNTKKLARMKITSSPEPCTSAVKVQTGAQMTELLTFLEKNGLGVYATPAPGDLTVGGVLAIDGHGTGVPAMGEIVTPGHSFGTLSNLIMSLTAVVWDSKSKSYILKTFQRFELEAKAFLVHLGRAFLTEVTLMVGVNYNLRCISRTDISIDELFADPATVNSSTQTFASFLDQTGRVEAIWFPFTDKPWIKIWSISPTKPPESLEV
jgi:FAD/FMN-containing dehydrogenase